MTLQESLDENVRLSKLVETLEVIIEKQEDLYEISKKEIKVRDDLISLQKTMIDHSSKTIVKLSELSKNMSRQVFV